MNARLRLHVLGIALVSVLAIFACSDDDNPAGGGGGDTTPPGVSSVTATDANHVEVTFGEPVTRTSAEDTDNYSIVPGAPLPVAQRKSEEEAGGGVSIIAAALESNNRTVILSTTTMSATDYTLSINGVSDLNGNVINEQIDEGFTGSNIPDNTPPEIVYRSPAANATGVALGAAIELTFSEPIQPGSLTTGFSMVQGSTDIPVTFQSDDQAHFTGTHALLETNTLYAIELTGIVDNSANVMADAQWSFRTTTTTDTSPPTLVSSIPANLTLNVDVNSNFSLTFSEAINEDEFSPLLSPEIDGLATWSNGGKTVTFDPTNPLADDTQYTLVLLPGDVQDLAGNANTGFVTLLFSTGAAFENGSFAGAIAGDPNSDTADDPTGALVFAPTAFIFSADFEILGFATVAGNDTYNIMRLPDETYYPFTIVDSNDDGAVDPFNGDAIGFYGIDVAGGDFSEDSVTVAGGSDATGINFPLRDPTAVSGTINYKGAYVAEAHTIFVGLFEVAGFDPETSEPVLGTEASWPSFPSYFFNTLESELVLDGDYYVGAFLDVNDSGELELGIDPVGLYGGEPPTAIDLSGGRDMFDVNVLISDPPVPPLKAGTTHWATQPHAPWLKKLSEKVKQAQLAQQK